MTSAGRRLVYSMTLLVSNSRHQLFIERPEEVLGGDEHSIPSVHKSRKTMYKRYAVHVTGKCGTWELRSVENLAWWLLLFWSRAFTLRAYFFPTQLRLHI